MKRLLILLIALAWLNFAAFFLIAFSIGGDAVNGWVEDGRYYVNNHGTATEVSRGVYVYSYAHSVSVWITHGAVFLAALWIILRWLRLNSTRVDDDR